MLSRYARGGEVFAFNARSGTIPLPLGRVWGQVAFGDRLLLLVRDRLPGELRKQGTGWLRGQAAGGLYSLVGD